MNSTARPRYNDAHEVRDFLRRRFATVKVVLLGRQVFPGVQTGALLLLADGSGGTDRVHSSSVDDASQLRGGMFETVLVVQPGER